MKLLLDSHVLLWAIYEPEKLSPLAASVIAESRNDLYVSHATLWELSNKAAVYRLPLVGSSPARMIERIEQLGVTFLPMTRPDILAAATLPFHHADPFDRMPIAQAQSSGLCLVSKDSDIRRYDVQTLWA